jgi:hypothetical protein
MIDLKKIKLYQINFTIKNILDLIKKAFQIELNFHLQKYLI